MAEQAQNETLDPRGGAEQRRAALRTTLVLLIIVLIVGAAAFWYLWNFRLQHLGTNESVNVLVLGVGDEGVETAVLTSFNPQTDAVAAIAVPPDTRLPWSGESDMQDVYATLFAEDDAVPAFSRTGAEAEQAEPEQADQAEPEQVEAPTAAMDEGAFAKLKETFERLFDVPIHHTVRLDFAGFVRLVDLLDGVPVEVDAPIVYRDAKGDVTFSLEPGTRRLTGADALMYVRYKGDHLEDESRRIRRQAQFLQALVREVQNELDWTDVQEVLRIALTHVGTDLDLTTATRLARFAFEGERDEFTLQVVPGASEDGVWIVDEAGLAALGERLFYNPSWEAAER